MTTSKYNKNHPSPQYYRLGCGNLRVHGVIKAIQLKGTYINVSLFIADASSRTAVQDTHTEYRPRMWCCFCGVKAMFIYIFMMYGCDAMSLCCDFYSIPLVPTFVRLVVRTLHRTHLLTPLHSPSHLPYL